MLHWLEQTTALVATPVATAGAPVLSVVHDRDGDWQMLCGTVDAVPENAQLVHLFHAVDRDPSIAQALDLEPGWRADREGVDAPWQRSRLAESDDG